MRRPPAAGTASRPWAGRRKALVAGAGLVSLVLLATVLVVRSWSDDSGVPHPGATTWGAPSGSHTRPGPEEKPPAASPSPASAGEPVEIAHGRLRSLDAGLCADVRGDRVRAGADLRLGPCSDAGSQQWSYQDDGMLRSALDPTLCLAADPGARSVVVSGCLVHAGEVSYDLTVAGELLLRWDKGLALSADGTKVVVAGRDGSVRQRWALDTGSGAAAAPAAGPSTSPEPKKDERTESPGPSPQAVPDQEFGKPQDPSYGTRVAQVGSHDRPVPVVPPGLPGPAEPVGALAEAAGPVLDSVGPVLDSVPDVVSVVGTLLGRPSPVGEDGAARGGRTS